MKILIYKYKLVSQRGAPKASGMRSIVYRWLEMNIIGTPGIFLTLRLRSLSQVATI